MNFLKCFFLVQFHRSFKIIAQLQFQKRDDSPRRIVQKRWTIISKRTTSFLKPWIDFYIYFVREYKTMLLS